LGRSAWPHPYRLRSRSWPLAANASRQRGCAYGAGKPAGNTPTIVVGGGSVIFARPRTVRIIPFIVQFPLSFTGVHRPKAAVQCRWGSLVRTGSWTTGGGGNRWLFRPYRPRGFLGRLPGPPLVRLAPTQAITLRAFSPNSPGRRRPRTAFGLPMAGRPASSQMSTELHHSQTFRA
jgi:hypothetical protein